MILIILSKNIDDMKFWVIFMTLLNTQGIFLNNIVSTAPIITIYFDTFDCGIGDITAEALYDAGDSSHRLMLISP